MTVKIERNRSRAPMSNSPATTAWVRSPPAARNASSQAMACGCPRRKSTRTEVSMIGSVTRASLRAGAQLGGRLGPALRQVRSIPPHAEGGKVGEALDVLRHGHDLYDRPVGRLLAVDHHHAIDHDSAV